MTMAGVQTLSLVSILFSPFVSEAVITNISVIQIPQWFFALTPYESVFAGLTFLWICMLDFVGILPLNLNSLFYGNPSGRRKRRGVFNPDTIISPQQKSLNFKTKQVTDAILITLRRLDEDECVPRSLCELERQITFGYEPPHGIKQILNGLKWSHHLRHSNRDSIVDMVGGSGHPLQFYETAVNTGYTAGGLGPTSNSTTVCQQRYASCPITIESILNYVSTLHFDDFY